MSKTETFSAEDFLEGRLLLIDKPLEWTSFDAVNKIKFALLRRFDLKKIKVGHAGTLDPLATGLLLICTGRMTKKISELTGLGKTYEGKFLLGSTTPSYDMETETENHLPTDRLTENQVAEAAQTFVGEQEQMPPMYSAKKVGGQRAYRAARKGKTIDLQPNRVVIHSFEADVSQLPTVGFRIVCSKGTYIRSIARDLGEKLGCGAHLISLRRTAIGDHQVDDAVSPQSFVDGLNEVHENDGDHSGR